MEFRLFKYHKELADYMVNLRRIKEELKIRKEDIEQSLLQKKPKLEVDNWLKKAREVLKDAEDIEDRANKVKFHERHRIGKLAEQKIQKIKEVVDAGQFDSLTDDDASSTEVPVEVEVTAKEKIWKHLMGKEISKIGVCGVGGIGKTTIMKNIYHELLNETRFDRVIWATVSKQFDVGKLQKDIASALNVDLSKHGDGFARNGVLSAVLRKQKRCVLMLDDVWQDFHLEVVGIPEPSVSNRCKLVLTSRSVDVCRKIGCEVVDVEPLSEEEALDLFLSKVGHEILKHPTIQPILKAIVEQCAGLPLAIITVAGSMRGVYDFRLWMNALNEMRGRMRSMAGGREDKVLQPLKFSYDRLEEPKIRKCFLYCALYPQDFEIVREELIECWIVEELIEEMETRQAMYSKGHTILSILEDKCLLEATSNGKCVKMHDLVRDMVLSITSTTSPRFMVKAGTQLEEFSNEQEWTEDLEKVSLMWNSIPEFPSDKSSPNCPKLSTLLLQVNHNLGRIPESFFLHMHSLKTLDLSDTRIEVLPSSISELLSLTALLLNSCHFLRHVPSLAKLRALKKLDLGGTSIVEVPQGMESLINLTYLDLRTWNLLELPVGTFSKLSHLQYLAVYFASKTLRGRTEELAGLMKLETFIGDFYDLQELNMYVKHLQDQGERLTNYNLQVGQGWHRSRRYIGLYQKAVGLIRCSINGDSVELPTDIQYLTIEWCNNVKSITDFHSLKDAADFRGCSIWNCDAIECVLSLSSLCYNLLWSLEKLSLAHLQKLNALFKEFLSVPSPVIPPGTFSHLKVFEIYECPKIKKLFFPALLQNFQNLEEMKVYNCPQMVEIIAADTKSDDQQGLIRFTLPKLRVLKLKDLPKLKSICNSSEVLVCDSLQEIELNFCLKLSRIPLLLPVLDDGQPSHPPALKSIEIYPKEWWELLEWDHSGAKNVLQPFCKFIRYYYW